MLDYDHPLNIARRNDSPGAVTPRLLYASKRNGLRRMRVVPAITEIVVFTAIEVRAAATR